MALVIILTIFFFMIFCVARYLRPNVTYKPQKALATQHLSIEEIRRLNKMHAKRKAAEVEVERGKVLAFKRKIWYSSTKRGLNDTDN